MFMKLQNKKLKFSLQLVENIIGNFIYAFGVIAFCEPNGLITGGVTGIALALHYAFGWNTSLFAGIMNVAFFILGFFVLGRKFALSTLISSVVYPLWMLLLEQFDYSYFATGSDILIPVLASAIFMGAGIAIVMRSGGSTGGLDIPVLILHKFFGFPVGFGISLFDFLVLFAQAFIPSTSFTLVAYGFVMVVLYSFVIDKVLLLGNKKMEIKIMTRKKEEMSRMILHEMDRGLTYLHSETGYFREERDFILTVVDVRELMKFKSMIYDTDPEAFVIITNVSEVRGRGFSSDKKYEKEAEEETKQYPEA